LTEAFHHMPSKLIVYIAASLDGYIARTDGNIWVQLHYQRK
jgi:hypothetical protein